MAPDYIEKYGPLLQILQGGDEDLNTLAEEGGYTTEIGRQWRKTQLKAISGYMRAIRTDYEVLWQQASGKALFDPVLASLLVKTDNQLRRLERKMRFYIFLQKIVPTHFPGERSGSARSILSNVFPTVDRSEVVQLLSAMRTLHRNADAKIFLP